MDFQTFITAFPEFGSVDESRATYFIELAEGAIPDGRFGKETDFGKGLYVAHYLSTLGSGANGEGSGSTPKGVIASKAVGSVSISYDTGSTAESEAGFWNSTGYGRMYWQLLKRYRRLPTVVVGRAQWP